MMPVADSPFVIWCSAGYLVVCVAIGVWSTRRTRTSADYFVAGRRLGVLVTVISWNVSLLSAFAFIGGPGIVFASGSSTLWMALGFVGGPLALLLVGKRLRLLAEVRDILTLPDAVAARYGGRWPRAAMALAMILGVIGYLGTQILAFGLILTAVLGVSLPTAMLIGLGVLAFYSVAGGMVAAVYTDVFQGALMAGAAVGIFYCAIQAAGGVSQASTTLWAMDPEFIGPWGTLGPMAALNWFMVCTLVGVGQPHTLTKFLMLHDVRSLKWFSLLSAPTSALLVLIWLSVGLAMRCLVETGAEAPLASPDLATPLFLLNHTPPLLAGIALAGVLSAIMSTSDSFLNVGAAALIRDIPTALLGRPLRAELLWSRVTTAVLLVVSALFALYMETLTALLGVFGAGTFGAAIVPAIAIGFNWKRATASACVSSILTSLALNFGLEILNRHGVYSLPNGLLTSTLSVMASIVVFVVVSLLGGDSGRKALPRDITAVMEA